MEYPTYGYGDRMGYVVVAWYEGQPPRAFYEMTQEDARALIQSLSGSGVFCYMGECIRVPVNP